MKSHIESMYGIETGRRWKMKTTEFYTQLQKKRTTYMYLL